jgi:hypothetical protein
MFLKRRPFYPLKLCLLLICLNVFSQTKSNKSGFQYEKLSNTFIVASNTIFWENLKNQTQSTNLSAFPLIENQLLISDKKELNPLDIEKKQDTVNKMLLKTKMNAERWRCTYPEPKKIATQKAAEEQFKKSKK